MNVLISFLILVLNLVLLGVVYWVAVQLLGLIPATFLADNYRAIILTVLKVIFVLVGAVWSINWLIGLLGGGGWNVPTPFHRSLRS